jgi:uncharacterized surface protein with fasciclin (FAS1) repeats
MAQKQGHTMHAAQVSNTTTTTPSVTPATVPNAAANTAASAILKTTADSTGVAPQDIVQIAAGAPNFSTLTSAIKAAGLVDTLKTAGPFTVFAPTNEAFAALPAGTVDKLLKPESKPTLVKVLTYHVVPGKWMAADVVKLTSAKTVNGQSVKITVDGGKVQLAAGVTADRMARIKAGELVNFVALQVGGKGGGKADMAMAGGSDAAAVPAALASVQGWVRERI